MAFEELGAWHRVVVVQCVTASIVPSKWIAQSSEMEEHAMERAQHSLTGAPGRVILQWLPKLSLLGRAVADSCVFNVLYCAWVSGKADLA